MEFAPPKKIMQSRRHILPPVLLIRYRGGRSRHNFLLQNRNGRSRPVPMLLLSRCLPHAMTWDGRPLVPLAATRELRCEIELRRGSAYEEVRVSAAVCSGGPCVMLPLHWPCRLSLVAIVRCGLTSAFTRIKSSIGDSLNVVVPLDGRPGRRFITHVLEMHSYHPDADLFDYRGIFQEEEAQA
jgi:hypothetical protein